jgi:hypothetical protein
MLNNTRDFAPLALSASASISKIRLTKTTTRTTMTAPRSIEVGFSSSNYKGDNTPQSLAVFLCPSFFGFLKFREANIIMVVLLGQPFWLVVPLYDSANSFNTATNCLAALRDGFTPLNKGITAS